MNRGPTIRPRFFYTLDRTEFVSFGEDGVDVRFGDTDGAEEIGALQNVRA